MNYYPHHIGDYVKDTAHLTMIEDGAYRRLIDLYYLHEKPLPKDKKQVYRLARASTAAEKKAINVILDEYFEDSDLGFRHKRCDEEIANYQEKNDDEEARRENEKERQRRHRQRRKELFDALREYGEVPPWDAKTTELETLLSRCQERPVTRDSNVPVTPHATANPITKPNPNNHIAAATVPTEERQARERDEITPPPEIPENKKSKPDPEPDRIPDATQNRAAQMTVLLRRNGACPRIHPRSKGVDQLVADDVTDAELLVALETAKKRRKAQSSSQPITVAYLLPIIADQRATPAVKPGAAPPRDEWWKSQSGIDRKAREMGMFARGTEDYNSFKDRIFEEIRKRESQGVTT